MRLNQLGVSLIQVMFAVAAVSGAGVLIMRNQEVATKVNQKAAFDSDVENATNQIRIALSNRSACNNAITQLVNNGSISKINFMKSVNGTNTLSDLFTVGDRVGSGGFVIKRVELVNPLSLTSSTTNYLKVTFGISSVSNRFIPIRGSQNKVSKVDREISQNIRLTMDKVISGSFSECYADSVPKVPNFVNTACANLGGVVNGSGKCNLVGLPKCMITKTGSCPANTYLVQSAHKVTIKQVSQVKRTCTSYYFHENLITASFNGYNTGVKDCYGPNCRVTPPVPVQSGAYPVYEGISCVDNYSYNTVTLDQCCRVNFPPPPQANPPAQGVNGTNNGGCFVVGTQINLPGGEKKSIEDVMVGDELVDGKGELVKVEALKRYPYKGLVYSINGGEYFFTPNHPFLTLSKDHKRVWKSLDPKKSMEESRIEVSMMQVGDLLVKENGLEMLYTLDAISYEGEVYNFTVTPSHEYVANEYVVHNLKNNRPQATTGGVN